MLAKWSRCLRRSSISCPAAASCSRPNARIVALAKVDGAYRAQYRLAGGLQDWTDLRAMYIVPGTEELPAETTEIKPHPYGIELGTLMKMLKETGAKKLGAFLSSEFSRVSPSIAKQVCAAAGVTPATWVNAVNYAPDASV